MPRQQLYIILTTLFIAIGLPISTYLVQTRQTINSHAATQVILPIPMKVLVLMYFPPDPTNSALLDGNETGWGTDATINGRTIANFWEPKTGEMVQAAIPLINDSTRYHGYKDSSAPAFLNYSVLDTKKFYIKIPRGFQLGTNTDGTPNYRPDYHTILTDQSICNLVDTQGVKEVWMYGYHSKYIVPDESRMSSKYGDISNSYPKEQSLPDQFKLPVCTNAYTLYNFTYQPGGGQTIGNNIHNRLHQIEDMIPFEENNPNIAQGTSTFWGDFSENVQNTTVHSYRSSCGNAHYTPNWTDPVNDNYHYNNTTPGTFNCETWNPDDSKTTYITAACERWGCTDVGFYKWYMQNLPGYNNGIVYNGQPMKNWWEAMYDFNKFVENGRSLYGTSIVTIGSGGTTPQPTTPSPTQVVTGATNLALGKGTISNRTAIGGHDSGKAVDGDTTTAGNSWQVNNPINPGDWFQVDLGTVQPVSKVVIYPNSSNYSDMCIGFTIAVSQTGAFTGEQTTVVTENSRPNTQTNTYTFSPVSGRFVRMTCNVTQNWVQLQEFQVYGGTVTSTPVPTTIQPTLTRTPTPSPTRTPTPTPTRTPTPTIVIPTSTPVPPTATPQPLSIKVNLTLLLHGLGTAGDNVAPGTPGNLTPLTPQRTVTLQLINSSNVVVSQPNGLVVYNSSTGDFRGVVDAGVAVPNGTYQVKVKTPTYLSNQIGSFFTLTQGQTTTLPSKALVVGDSNNDNQLNILDYNILLDCYSVFEPAKNCDPTKQKQADLNDDGKVNTTDTNLWQRELSVQSGV